MANYSDLFDFKILETKAYPRLCKRGVMVQFTNKKRTNTLTLELRVPIDTPARDFHAKFELSTLIVGAYSDFENYIDLHDIDSPSKNDFAEFKRQKSLLSKINKFFGYDSEVGNYSLVFAEDYFHDWINETLF